MVQHRLATDVYFTLNDGNKIPALGLGTIPSDDPADVKSQVIAAIRAGYRHIDTAWYYGSEKFIGEALNFVISEGIVKREDLFITTKVWPSFHKHPERSIDQSLKDLNLDYVDLVLQHWPICLRGDANGQPPLPRDEKGKLIYDDDPVNGDGYIEYYNKIEDYKFNTGKVKSVGVSNQSIPKLKKLLRNRKRYVPVLNQIEYHPQLPDQELVDFCQENKILVEAYGPVGGPGAPILKLPLVNELADKYEVSPNEIANAYHILSGRTTLPRSSNLARIKVNVRLPELTKDELDQLYQIGTKKPFRFYSDDWAFGIGLKFTEGDNLPQPNDS